MKLPIRVNRHAYWVETEETYSEGLPGKQRQSAKCSICGKYSDRPLGTFCRWCGAKMDGKRKVFD